MDALSAWPPLADLAPLVNGYFRSIVIADHPDFYLPKRRETLPFPVMLMVITVKMIV